LEKYKKETGMSSVQEDLTKASIAWENVVFSGAAHTWEEIKFLQDNWDGPIVLKGAFY
jgi:lactate 2-monooxygenase